MVQDKENGIQKSKNEEYIFDIPLDFQPDIKGLGNYYFNCMKKNGKAIAQYIADTNEEETYEEVLKNSVRTALHIKSRNLTKDDVIILCTTNQKYAIVPFIASLFLTIPVASLDPTLSLLDISHLIKEVEPKMLFVIPESVKVIEDALEESGTKAEIVVFGETDKYTPFSTFLEPHIDEEKFAPTPVKSLDDLAVIVFSSGTTGLPKGIMLSHYSLLAQAALVSPNRQKTEGLSNARDHQKTVGLSFSTLYWISAINILTSVIQSGNAKVISTKSDADNIWYLIDRYKVNSMLLSPTLAFSMLKTGRPDGIDISSLRFVAIAGSAMPEKQLLELRELLPGCLVAQGYGLSETSGVLTFFNLGNAKELLFMQNKPKSVGLPVPGTCCKIVDPDTEVTCGPNQQGELRVKSKFNMIGYYKRDASESFDSSGWLKTGDICYFDEDGCFYIVDRIKEMLKYRYFHVPPAMLENVIMKHPSVAEAVVVGIPHEEDGDHPMALIIPKKGCNIDGEDIKKFVEERVPDRMKLRGGVKFINSFPLTPSGKVRRKDLRDMAIRGEI